MLKIRFGREFIDLPRRKLTRKKLPETFAKYEARAPALPILAGRARQVQKKDLTSLSREAFDDEFQASRRAFADIDHAPHDASPVVEGLQRQTRISHFQCEIAAGERNHLFTGFEQRGLFGGLEETLNCRLELLGAAAGSPQGGGLTHCIQSNTLLDASTLERLGEDNAPSPPDCLLAPVEAGCYFDGMRRLLFSSLLAFTLGGYAHADAPIRGNYIGDWSGASGAGGKFKLSVAQESGKHKCSVSFEYAGQEVSTNVTLCKIEGPKIEAQYDFDLGGNRLQSTIHGDRKGSALEGKYQTKTLDSGSAVDEGDWKAAPAQ